MTRPLIGLLLRNVAFGAMALASIGSVVGGCLDRPVKAATPSVSSRVVDTAKQNKISKIDLLFMIDNSSSMADKQAILAQVVPDLVNRLVDPVCIDPTSGATVGARNANGSCTRGEPDFDPVKDIHIGIISSSIGDHGAAPTPNTSVCGAIDAGARSNAHNVDMAHLTHRTISAAGVESDVPTFMNLGFLNWSGGDAAAVSALVGPFTSMVGGVGQHGCGYEAQLEAIFRFLNDPNPYLTIGHANAMDVRSDAVLQGTDTALLTQRADFLRPDSLVAVIAVTDENDCSVIDGGQAFYSIFPPIGTGGEFSILGRGTSACLANPNDVCCFNCNVRDVPPNCPAPATDSECLKGPWTKNIQAMNPERGSDPQNLRCFDQKRKYGIDFLYPIRRYVDGFTKTIAKDINGNDFIDNNGNPLKNPLFDDLNCVNGKDRKSGQTCTPAGERDTSLVFFAGIVGVPWQDIAKDPRDLTQGYLTAKEITDGNIWKMILGQPNNDPGNHNAPILPDDVHMIESVGPRAGLAPVNGASNADPKNGHEWDPSHANPPNSDLQYACIFDLPPNQVKDCTRDPITMVASLDCDCTDDPPGMAAAMQNPLCQTGNNFGTTQLRAKGYPGTRELQVLEGLGDQAIIASICPANVTVNNRDDFGYRPAIRALVDRLRNALRGRCLPRTLQVDASHKAPCVVVESFDPLAGEVCNCSTNMKYPGRRDIPAGSNLVTDAVREAGSCYCEIAQLDAMADLIQCQTQASPMGVPDGWCYVDPAATDTDTMSPTFGMPTAGGTAACAVVLTCPATDKRIVRFVNPTSEPRVGATAFIMCQELAFPSTAGTGPANPCAP